MDTAAKPKAGLEDTVATSSAICYLDGDRGVLAYCGYDIHDLARHATFEEVCYLLWHRRLPTRAELGDLQAQLVAARPLPEPVLRLLRMLPPGDSMDLLRTLTSALSHYDADAADNSAPANYRKAIRLTAQISSLVAAMGRVNANGTPIHPDPVLSHAANFLYMLTGERPSGLATRAFDVALVLHADHELNASTFAARVAVSTGASLSAGTLAALATLSGPQHGGASSVVTALVDDLAGAEGSISEALRDWLGEGREVPGFGHRLYPNGDIRARALLGRVAIPAGYAEVRAAAEDLIGEGPNVDFALAALAAAHDLPPAAPMEIFALARSIGWLAHMLEQADTGSIIRPRARYTGPVPLVT